MWKSKKYLSVNIFLIIILISAYQIDWRWVTWYTLSEKWFDIMHHFQKIIPSAEYSIISLRWEPE